MQFVHLHFSGCIPGDELASGKTEHGTDYMVHDHETYRAVSVLSWEPGDSLSTYTSTQANQVTFEQNVVPGTWTPGSSLSL